MARTVRSILQEMRQHRDEANVRLADIARSLSWTEEHRAKKSADVTSRLQARIDALRSEAFGLVEMGRREADVALYRYGLSIGPQTSDAWQVALARRPFIQAELARGGPQDIVKLFQLARDADDTIGSWLVGVEGLRHLDALVSETTSVREAADARQAGDELHRLAFGEAYSQYRATLSELDNAEHELKIPVTTTEIADYQKSIGDAYHVQAEFVPVPD